MWSRGSRKSAWCTIPCTSALLRRARSGSVAQYRSAPRGEHGRYRFRHRRAGLGTRRAAARPALEWLSHAGRECRTMRALGSAALGLSYLAAGWVDVYFHPMLAPWDGAAGQVIAEEAGACSVQFCGQPLELYRARLHRLHPAVGRVGAAFHPLTTRFLMTGLDRPVLYSPTVYYARCRAYGGKACQSMSICRDCDLRSW